MALVQPDRCALPVTLINLTVAARRGGFHGTLRAPFRLAPVSGDGLPLQSLQRLLALMPAGCDAVFYRDHRFVMEGVGFHLTLTNRLAAKRWLMDRSAVEVMSGPIHNMPFASRHL